MSGYLLQVSIGPVQEFIAAARRTRDLWFGSFMLSEISKAAAKAIKDTNGILIFPYSHNLDQDLKQKSDFNVGNVILAEMADADSAKKASDAARKAANERWGRFVEETFSVLKGYVEKERWDYQEKDVVEFYSAWCPFEKDTYGEARQKVARMLAARKNLRDFKPWQGEVGIDKSSLDGLRESVLLKKIKLPRLKGVRIKDGEALDVIGCVKRVAGAEENFPSVSRVAVDPWIRGIACNPDTKGKLDELNRICEQLCKKNLLTRAESIDKGKQLFPYEGTALLPSRYKEIYDETKDDSDPEAKKLLGELKTIVSGLLSNLNKKNRPIEPYLAILAADGDKMGKAISRLKNPCEHRKFSNILSAFASNAKKIINEDYNGVCIYTGGDDVLAFLPVDKALGCARALYDAFGSLWIKEDGTPKWTFEENPTLSVGISIAHAMEDLEFLLKFCREAEKRAKNGTKKDDKDKGDKDGERNGLAVVIRARNDSEIAIREQWSSLKNSQSDALSDLSIDQQLLFWAECFSKGKIPSKFPYELRNVALFYKEWRDSGTINEAMQLDVQRIFKRKDVKLSEDDQARVVKYINTCITGKHTSIEKLANELLVAQWIAAAQQTATGGCGQDDPN